MMFRAPRLVAAGSLAVAAIAAPLAIAFTTGAGQAVAAPECLSTVTSNGSDPVCVGYSNGSPTNIGTPWGVYGPNSSTGGYNNGTVGPLLPGRIYTNAN